MLPVCQSVRFHPRPLHLKRVHPTFIHPLPPPLGGPPSAGARLCLTIYSPPPVCRRRRLPLPPPPSHLIWARQHKSTLCFHLQFRALASVPTWEKTSFFCINFPSWPPELLELSAELDLMNYASGLIANPETNDFGLVNSRGTIHLCKLNEKSVQKRKKAANWWIIKEGGATGHNCDILFQSIQQVQGRKSALRKRMASEKMSSR